MAFGHNSLCSIMGYSLGPVEVIMSDDPFLDSINLRHTELLSVYS